MKILLFQREGIGLLRTLIASETSRGVIRFYHPLEREWGIEISPASLGSALALVSELRWYLRRYVSAVLFGLEGDLWCTQSIARLIYEEREEVPLTDWPYRKFYRVEGNRLVEVSGAGMTGGHQVFEVLCTEEEFALRGPAVGDDAGSDDEAGPPGEDDRSGS